MVLQKKVRKKLNVKIIKINVKNIMNVRRKIQKKVTLKMKRFPL